MRVLTILFYLICIYSNNCLAELHLYDIAMPSLYENNQDTYKFDILKFKDYSIDHKKYDIKLEYNNNCLGSNLNLKLDENKKSYLGANLFYGLKPDLLNINSLSKIKVFNNSSVSSKFEISYGLTISSSSSNSVYTYDGSFNLEFKMYL